LHQIGQEVDTMQQGKPHTWDDDDTYWRSNYQSRPYASGSTNRYGGRNWNDIESDLSRGWNSYEHRGTSTWEQVKAAVRDAWDRVTGRQPVSSR
jgi:hypothetical protein